MRLQGLIDRPLAVAESQAVYSGAFAGTRLHFDDLVAEGGRAITAQDRAIFALCRPERLLDLVRRFTVFDGGVRKIARHQQFFGIRRAVERVKQFDADGRRRGGVIWHTQGSGKSLTMVMLGRALALDKDIANPRIVIVTRPRTTSTGRSGTHLQVVRDGTRPGDQRRASAQADPQQNGAGSLPSSTNSTPRRAVVRQLTRTRISSCWWTRATRSQTGQYGGHGELAMKMRRILPNACYPRFHRHAAAAKGEEYPVHLWRAYPHLRD